MITYRVRDEFAQITSYTAVEYLSQYETEIEVECCTPSPCGEHLVYVWVVHNSLLEGGEFCVSEYPSNCGGGDNYTGFGNVKEALFAACWRVMRAGKNYDEKHGIEW